MTEKGKTKAATKTKTKKAVTPQEEKPKTIGRPSLYSQKMADEICKRITEGLSLRKVCLAPDMPSIGTVCRWLSEGDKKSFQEQYARACEIRTDVMAEELMDLHEKAWVPVEIEGVPLVIDGKPVMTINQSSAAAVRLEADNKKWLMAKMKPKKYGDKVDLNHGGQVDNPVRALYEQLSGTPLKPKSSE